MKATLVNPSTIILPEVTPELRQVLSYRDKSVDYMLQKLKKNRWWSQSDPEGWLTRINELKSQAERSLIFDDGKNSYTYSGFIKRLEQSGHEIVPILGRAPIGTLRPWAVKPPEMYQYQKEAVESLVSSRHAAISLPTGSGKSYVLLNLVKTVGVKCVVICPLSSIAEQLYSTFEKHLGKQYVGYFGGGKKQSDKMVTVAVAQSLVKVEAGTEHYENFAKVQALMFDEAHTTPATTFEKVCIDIFKDAYYRFFVTATHTRTDGSEILLEGITGPVVYEKTFTELCDQGFLSPMQFTMFGVPCVENPNCGDADKETRKQLYLNPSVVAHAAGITNQCVQLAKRPTLLILDEMKQFAAIAPHIKVPYHFLHGGATAANRDLIPEEHRKPNIERSVAEFNAGKIPLLIGTSAISTGVDTKATQALIYLQGGISEIKVQQAIGRGTRTFPGKTNCLVFDYSVIGSKMMERHAATRAEIYSRFGSVKTYGQPIR